jgi:probable HAF family extracellular repeat protein
MDNRHDGPLRPFFWSKGKLRMLDLPVTERSLISYSINNDGLMVGISSDGARGEHTAVLYQHGQMYDLNTLIGDGQTLVMTFAMQINAKGYIVGWGKRDGKRRAFMLVPQSAQ